MQQKIRIYDIIKTYHNVLTSNKVLFIPFLVVGLFDFIALIVIYYAPRYPISIVLAPPIRKIWGDQYLHYPQNFALIPQLFNYAHICILFTIGIFMTGMFIKMCHIFLKSKKNILKSNVVIPSFVIAFKKYIPMVIYFLLFYGLTFFVFSIISNIFNTYVVSNRITKIIHLVTNFGLVVILQTLFAFVFPAIIISNAGLLKAFKINFTLVFSQFKRVVIIILIPSLIYVFISINKYFLPDLVQKYEPEVMLISLGFGILCTMCIDVLITGYTTIFYITNNEQIEDVGE